MKKVLQFFIFIFILYMIINKIGWKLRPDGTDYSIRQIQALHAYPDNTFEILVYGSSHSWTAFDSVRFQKEFGLNTYNYSDNWQKLNTTYLFIRDSLKKQSPKVIFIETYHIDSTMKDVDMNGEIYYTRAIPCVRRQITVGANCKLKSRLLPNRLCSLICNCTYISE